MGSILLVTCNGLEINTGVAPAAFDLTKWLFCKFYLTYCKIRQVAYRNASLCARCLNFQLCVQDQTKRKWFFVKEVIIWRLYDKKETWNAVRKRDWLSTLSHNLNILNFYWWWPEYIDFSKYILLSMISLKSFLKWDFLSWKLWAFSLQEWASN